jgi:hypothetical protein
MFAAENTANDGNPTGTAMYNNTCVTISGIGNGGGMQVQAQGSVAFENNVTLFNSTAGTTANSVSTTYAASSLNYNVYTTTFNSNFNYNGAGYSTLAGWQGATGQDGNSTTSSANLNASYQPVSPSSAIGLGTNLTSLCSGEEVALCSDAAGNTRPSTGAWTAGALNAYQNISRGASFGSGVSLGSGISAD